MAVKYPIRRALDYLLEQKLDDIGIRPLAMLLALAQQPETGRRLADRFDIPKSAVSRSVAKLERDGYIERLEDPSDRRSVFLALTDEGKAFVAMFS